MSAKPIRDGFHTVTPYLFITGAARLIQFLSEAFDAQHMNRKDRPDGAVMHAAPREFSCDTRGGRVGLRVFWRGPSGPTTVVHVRRTQGARFRSLLLLRTRSTRSEEA
jgi:hypothetical protein